MTKFGYAPGNGTYTLRVRVPSQLNRQGNDLWQLFQKIGGCQNYGPLLGTLKIRCSIKIGTQKGTIILTTTQIGAIMICRSEEDLK